MEFILNVILLIILAAFAVAVWGWIACMAYVFFDSRRRHKEWEKEWRER